MKAVSSIMGTARRHRTEEEIAGILKDYRRCRFGIGGPGATPEVAGFVQVLQEGRAYRFPEAFQEYWKGPSEKR